MPDVKTCPECGKKFTPWRKKMFCSEKCAARVRKRTERAAKAMIPDAEKSGENIEQNQSSPEAMSRDESPAFVVRNSEWSACNEITDQLTYKGTAIGWAMMIEGRGWFGRVGNEMSFGPTNRRRARQAVEAFLKGEVFEKIDAERSWRGNCNKLVNLWETSERPSATA